MNLRFATNEVNNYQINTPVYQGPLDLLLQLIENAELDITKLSLAKVTNQYLLHLKEMESSPPDEISAFLVIAAKLLLIKSNALLPHSSQTEDQEEDVGDDLARQLLAYKRYKEIAELLADRKMQGYQSYVRISSDLDLNSQVDFGDFDILALYEMARQVFQTDLDRKSIDTVVERPKVLLKDKLAKISTMLKRAEQITFRAILGDHYSKMDVVISFLAVLELVKRRQVVVRQESLFHEIMILKIEGSLDLHDLDINGESL